MSALTTSKTPFRITFPVENIAQGREILTHLTEERLVSGGTVIHAESVNWVGGEITGKERREVAAYTTYENLPLIRSRASVFFERSGEEPTISQFAMMNEKEAVSGWIGRNVR
jgi:hypothetical protein